MKALKLRIDEKNAEIFIKKLKKKVTIDNIHKSPLKKVKGFFRGDGGLPSQIVSSVSGLIGFLTGINLSSNND